MWFKSPVMRRLDAIEAFFVRSLKNQEKIMSGLDDAHAALVLLSNNVSALATDVQSNTAAVNDGVAKIAALAAQIAAGTTGDSDVDVEALATQITAQAQAVAAANTAVQGATSALQASITPAPTPAAPAMTPADPTGTQAAPVVPPTVTPIDLPSTNSPPA